jgi:hypothetical protein
MSWKRSKFVTSFLSLFGEAAPVRSSAVRVQEVRQAMLDCFQGIPPSDDQENIRRRVLYAPDIQSLWYLRSGILTLLAHALGESEAHARLAKVTALFVGLLPAAQKPRISRHPR